jgi:hypothetical protein
MTPLPGQGVEKPKFKIVCDYCGSLSIKVSDPATSPSKTVVRCGSCNVARGTLGELHELARQGKGDSFEF